MSGSGSGVACKLSTPRRQHHRYATTDKKTTNQLARNTNSTNSNASNNNNNTTTTTTAKQHHNINCDADDKVCDICAQNVPGSEREEIFSVGKCDHFVCYVCSARLRVICDQFDCPICREKLDKVIFSNSKKRGFDKYNLKDCLYNEKYKIYFTSVEVMDAFDKLLRYECLQCLKNNLDAERKRRAAQNKQAREERQKISSGKESRNKSSQKDSVASSEQQQANDAKAPTSPSPLKDEKASKETEIRDRINDESQGLLKPSTINVKIFPDVFGLTNHLNYVHNLRLCDLCLTHNKLFPFEYSYYTNEALHKHTKKGEPNTPHRGHPSCTLCGNTFFNNDELIQHMSREHYHCHLCGRHESNLRIYFLDYESLRRHFKSQHYLCERDSCRHEQFTSAFDNLIDFQLHSVQQHGNQSSSLSRSEARQQRTITLDSTSHRQRTEPRSLQSLQRDLPRNAAVVTTGTIAIANSARQQRPESIQVQLRSQRLPTRAEFPALGQNVVTSVSISHPQTTGNQQLPTSQFPSLSQPASSNQPNQQASTSSNANGAATPFSQRLVAGPSTVRTSFVKTLGGGGRQMEQLNESDFPPLELKPKQKSKTKVKPVKRQKEPTGGSKKTADPIMTLDQLISASLSLSQNNKANHGKKGGASMSGRSGKQKPLKIQL